MSFYSREEGRAWLVRLQPLPGPAAPLLTAGPWSEHLSPHVRQGGRLAADPAAASNTWPPPASEQQAWTSKFNPFLFNQSNPVISFSSTSNPPCGSS